jgi:hypothetical protein
MLRNGPCRGGWCDSRGAGATSIGSGRIALKVSDQLLVVTALLERRKANLLVELHGLRHCADAERIGSHFIEGRRDIYSLRTIRAAAAARTKRQTWSDLATLPLSDLGDQLERFRLAMDFESFRPEFE